MDYESSPKHKTPWQRGNRGALCPGEIDLTTARKLLAESEANGDARYAVHDGRAYCARQHGPNKWHGYPSVGIAFRNAFGASGSQTAACDAATSAGTGTEP